jgi:hypothetical protein
VVEKGTNSRGNFRSPVERAFNNLQSEFRERSTRKKAFQQPLLLTSIAEDGDEMDVEIPTIYGSVRESGETGILRGFLKRTYFRSTGRPNDTFSPEWPINWGLAVEMALRGRDDGRSTETVLLALGAWKPAKDTCFHIPTATVTAACQIEQTAKPS